MSKLQAEHPDSQEIFPGTQDFVLPSQRLLQNNLSPLSELCAQELSAAVVTTVSERIVLRGNNGMLFPPEVLQPGDSFASTDFRNDYVLDLGDANVLQLNTTGHAKGKLLGYAEAVVEVPSILLLQLPEIAGQYVANFTNWSDVPSMAPYAKSCYFHIPGHLSIPSFVAPGDAAFGTADAAGVDARRRALVVDKPPAHFVVELERLHNEAAKLVPSDFDTDVRYDPAIIVATTDTLSHIDFAKHNAPGGCVVVQVLQGDALLVFSPDFVDNSSTEKLKVRFVPAGTIYLFWGELRLKWSHGLWLASPGELSPVDLKFSNLENARVVVCMRFGEMNRKDVRQWTTVEKRIMKSLAPSEPQSTSAGAQPLPTSAGATRTAFSRTKSQYKLGELIWYYHPKFVACAIYM